jgi:exodeoxyribonuclease-3
MAKRTYRLVSWNVNGLRAAMNKDFLGSVGRLDADILGIQETKLQESQLTEEMRAINGYRSYFSHAVSQKGYSGVAVYCRPAPEKVTLGFGEERFESGHHR